MYRIVYYYTTEYIMYIKSYTVEIKLIVRLCSDQSTIITLIIGLQPIIRQN